MTKEKYKMREVTHKTRKGIVTFKVREKQEKR